MRYPSFLIGAFTIQLTNGLKITFVVDHDAHAPSSSASSGGGSVVRGLDWLLETTVDSGIGHGYLCLEDDCNLPIIKPGKDPDGCYGLEADKQVPGKGRIRDDTERYKRVKQKKDPRSEASIDVSKAKSELVKEYIRKSIANPPKFNAASALLPGDPFNCWDYIQKLYSETLGTIEKPDLLDIWDQDDLRSLNLWITNIYIFNPEYMRRYAHLINVEAPVEELATQGIDIKNLLELSKYKFTNILTRENYVIIQDENDKSSSISKRSVGKSYTTFQNKVSKLELIKNTGKKEEKTIRTPVFREEISKTIPLKGQAYFIPEDANPKGEFTFKYKELNDPGFWSIAVGNRISENILDFSEAKGNISVNFDKGTVLVDNKLRVVFDNIQKIIGGSKDDSFIVNTTKTNRVVKLDGRKGVDRYNLDRGNIVIDDSDKFGTLFFEWTKLESLSKCSNCYYCGNASGISVKAKLFNGEFKANFESRNEASGQLFSFGTAYVKSFKNGNLGVTLHGENNILDSISRGNSNAVPTIMLAFVLGKALYDSYDSKDIFAAGINWIYGVVKSSCEKAKNEISTFVAESTIEPTSPSSCLSGVKSVIQPFATFKNSSY